MNEPTIAILLAVYEPKEDWLFELLDSLNAQTYPSLHLYVRDDASPTYPPERLQQVLEQHITHFPFTLNRNEQNLGSNRTFEALVRDCCEPYIAFCDQDDVWLPEKLSNTYALLTQSPLSPTLVCTNVSVMDGEGKETAARMEDHRKRHIFLRGKGLAKELIYRNFVMGCTVLMERERAVAYLPFPQGIVHDHYLAYRAALDGALDYLPTPQMRYRVYGGNQTGVMTKVRDKESYRRERIDVFLNRVNSFAHDAAFPALEQAHLWGEARLANYNREKHAMRRLWRMRDCGRSVTLFELIALRLPLPLFRFAVKMIQKGLL